MKPEETTAAVPPPLKHGVGRPERASVGDMVWFRMGRMYGNPPQPEVRAMVTRVHAHNRVDLEFGCEDMSQVSGTAGMVAHIDSLPDAMKEQQACWWVGEKP